MNLPWVTGFTWNSSRIGKPQWLTVKQTSSPSDFSDLTRCRSELVRLLTGLNIHRSSDSQSPACLLSQKVSWWPSQRYPSLTTSVWPREAAAHSSTHSGVKDHTATRASHSTSNGKDKALMKQPGNLLLNSAKTTQTSTLRARLFFQEGQMMRACLEPKPIQYKLLLSSPGEASGKCNYQLDLVTSYSNLPKNEYRERINLFCLIVFLWSHDCESCVVSCAISYNGSSIFPLYSKQQNEGSRKNICSFPYFLCVLQN